MLSILPPVSTHPTIAGWHTETDAQQCTAALQEACGIDGFKTTDQNSRVDSLKKEYHPTSAGIKEEKNQEAWSNMSGKTPSTASGDEPGSLGGDMKDTGANFVPPAVSYCDNFSPTMPSSSAAGDAEHFNNTTESDCSIENDGAAEGDSEMRVKTPAERCADKRKMKRFR